MTSLEHSPISPIFLSNFSYPIFSCPISPIFFFYLRSLHIHSDIQYLLSGQMKPFFQETSGHFLTFPFALSSLPVLKLFIVFNRDHRQKVSLTTTTTTITKHSKNRVFILSSWSPRSVVSSRNSKKLVRLDLPLFFSFLCVKHASNL